MNRFLVLCVLALGAASVAAPALAQLDVEGDSPSMLMNARIAQERSRTARLGTSNHADADTVWVGYNPAYAGSNYWSIGVGHRRPRGTTGPGKGDIIPVPDEDTGYWDWEHPVHGDSLQGWWPMRNSYNTFFVANLPDAQRPWHAIDIGNSLSYVINQGPGNRRTFGVTSAWHEDPGMGPQALDPAQPDANPRPPRWTPIAGGMSAWCGIRSHGDVTQIDALTGNPYNATALGAETINASATIATGPGWTNYRFPGYAQQWDQMLYRDIDISDTTVALSAAPVSVTFSFRTRMSTGKGVNATTRTGWFDKDPLTVNAGNFISSTNAGLAAPIDSFMVYVGAPVADTAGAEWRGSDGLTHQVFDPVRRWFGELIRANAAGGHYQLFTTYGDDPPIASPADSNAFRTVTAMRNVTYGQLRAAWGGRIRLVFRSKTNRGFSDDEGSLSPSAYNSGYLGAAQLDDVSINLGGGPVALGGFESKGDIDNATDNDQIPQLGYVTNNWHTSSKPPAVFQHVHELADLLYEDLCGPPGSPNRICNLAGNIISMGDHDLGEAFNGPFGTAEQEQFHTLTSPTINLSAPAGPARNNMGLTQEMATPTSNWLFGYEMYTGGFDLFTLGSDWAVFALAYPAEQTDGTRCWTTKRHGRFNLFNPDKQCFQDYFNLDEFGEVRTTNPNGIPDSIKVGIRKRGTCYRFGITTNCGNTLGGYVDNVSLGIVDGAAKSLSVLIWELWQDTFPANETPGLPGTAGFDTTTALIKGGLNTAPLTGGFDRYDVPQDSLQVDAPGDSVELQLKFRIMPGPGNYVIAGDRCSGLRRVASDSARITPGDGSFWSEYIENPGKDKDEMPVTGDCKGGGTLRHDQRWSELVWCNARMDTAEANLFPIGARNINSALVPSAFATMYHEDDKHLATLGLARHKCFLVDTSGPVACGGTFFPCNVTCNSVPAWVTMGGAPYKTGYDGIATTKEGTKILPDGLLTPGSHVQYFFLKKDLDLGLTTMVPDTNVVYPQPGEASFDAHRWQQFSVLPDAWKFTGYGGLGKACMLYVDWNDRNGTERVWVSIADSAGGTGQVKRGAHNGWGGTPSSGDINDPAYFMNKNAQPGTTWDMYGVKAAESLNSQSGTIGARLAYRGGGTLLTDKWAKNAPTPEMLEAYYRVLMILTGGLNTFALTGPFTDRSQDDTEVIRQFVTGATAQDHRGLFVQGDAYVEDLDGNGNTTMQNILSVSLREASYLRFSGNDNYCVDLIPQSPITTNGDIYGIRNTCLQTLDVLQPQGDGVVASYYDPVGANALNAPYVASVFTDAEPAGNPDNHWQALIDGWDAANLRSRMCDNTNGRMKYMLDVSNNIFGKICAILASPICDCLDVPNNVDGRPFVDLAGIGNNPLRSGHAVIHLSLAQADRVTVKIYDVSGRLVRTLADGQLFKAGRVDPALTWDGLDDAGRGVARGAYFVNVRYERSRFETAKKMIVLR